MHDTQNIKVISKTPVLTVHATYVANDYVGTSATPIEFDDAALQAGGKGLVVSARLIDYATQSIAAELWLFNSSVTPPNDSSAWDLSDADSKKLIAVIPFSTYYASASNSVSPGAPIAPAVFQCGDGSRSIFGCLVTRGAPAYASGDITILLSVVQE